MGKQNAFLGALPNGMLRAPASRCRQAVRSRQQALPAERGKQLHCILCKSMLRRAGAKDENDLQMCLLRAIIYSV